MYDRCQTKALDEEHHIGLPFKENIVYASLKAQEKTFFPYI